MTLSSQSKGSLLLDPALTFIWTISVWGWPSEPPTDNIRVYNRKHYVWYIWSTYEYELKQVSAYIYIICICKYLNIISFHQYKTMLKDFEDFQRFFTPAGPHQRRCVLCHADPDLLPTNVAWHPECNRSSMLSHLSQQKGQIHLDDEWKKRKSWVRNNKKARGFVQASVWGIIRTYIHTLPYCPSFYGWMMIVFHYGNLVRKQPCIILEWDMIYQFLL